MCHQTRKVFVTAAKLAKAAQNDERLWYKERLAAA
jgi:hypothetical protein